ncbi:hypothetical protein PHAMO_10219 [Magnetospirillum molischianum DSM 120]|uniref:Uncharacterized protein n=1 Tax=Magnetospirillum molischianum DSM 120 TaxID=1150626 RepID=H8FN56_MAGML|nr:hypothetical protein PHAMO_10219 [Magnetospirillum molischianum DSM 120]
MSSIEVGNIIIPANLMSVHVLVIEYMTIFSHHTPCVESEVTKTLCGSEIKFELWYRNRICYGIHI